MTVEARQILDDYLSALEGELRDLSPSDRAEIVLEFREHFEDARREVIDPTEAQLRNIVERLGAPSEIAAEARARFGVEGPTPAAQAVPSASAAQRFGALEIAAVVGWFAWWPVGVLLSGISPRWSRRDKVIALAIEVGFFAVIGGVASTIGLIAGGGHVGYSHYFILLVFMLIPPSFPGIFGAAYLAWKLSRPGVRAWSPEWMLAGRIALVVVGGWLVWVMVLGPLSLLLMKGAGG